MVAAEALDTTLRIESFRLTPVFGRVVGLLQRALSWARSRVACAGFACALSRSLDRLSSFFLPSFLPHRSVFSSCLSFSERNGKPKEGRECEGEEGKERRDKRKGEAKGKRGKNSKKGKDRTTEKQNRKEGKERKEQKDRKERRRKRERKGTHERKERKGRKRKEEREPRKEGRMKDDKRSSERESAQAKPAQATRDRAQDKARCRRTTTRPNTGVNRNDSIRSLVSSASAATTSPTSLKLSEN